MAKGDSITASRFNSIRASMVGIMGLGSGVSGYGQDVLSTAAVAGQTISAAAFNNLRTDLGKAYTHQTGDAIADNLASNPIYQNPPNLQLITAGTPISNNITLQYDNFVNNALTGILVNKAFVHSSQLDIVEASTTTRATAWGGTSQVQTVSHKVTFTFAGYTQGSLAVDINNHMRCYFNAGGTINISASRADGTVSNKNTAWTNMLSAVGTISFKNTGSSRTGIALNTGGTFASSLGLTSLTIGAASATTLLTQPGPTGVYAENDYIVEVRRPTVNELEFTITFRDDAVGNPNFDEIVDGTLTSATSTSRPSGIYVDVPAPTASATAIV